MRNVIFEVLKYIGIFCWNNDKSNNCLKAKSIPPPPYNIYLGAALPFMRQANDFLFRCSAKSGEGRGTAVQ